jgi:hypothetical protein
MGRESPGEGMKEIGGECVKDGLDWANRLPVETSRDEVMGLDIHLSVSRGLKFLSEF